MLLKLFLAFTLIPVGEIYLLISVGTKIGAINTVILVIATGFTGAYLAKIQGMQTLYRVQTSLQQGIMPKEDLMDALIIFIAGIVLLTPGFLTDTTGILLLIPGTRNLFKRFIRKKIDQWMIERKIHFNRFN